VCTVYIVRYIVRQYWTFGRNEGRGKYFTLDSQTEPITQMLV